MQVKFRFFPTLQCQVEAHQILPSILLGPSYLKRANVRGSALSVVVYFQCIWAPSLLSQLRQTNTDHSESRKGQRLLMYAKSNQVILVCNIYTFRPCLVLMIMILYNILRCCENGINPSFRQLGLPQNS